jgi:hypothetical protein
MKAPPEAAGLAISADFSPAEGLTPGEDHQFPRPEV